MLIRIILIVSLALIGYTAFLKRRKLPVHLFILLIILAMAGLFVVMPEITNKIAHFLGVGRGVDLINYIVEVFLLFIVIHYYSKFVDIQLQITTLVREMALLKEENRQLKERLFSKKVIE